MTMLFKDYPETWMCGVNRTEGKSVAKTPRENWQLLHLGTLSTESGAHPRNCNRSEICTSDFQPALAANHLAMPHPRCTVWAGDTYSETGGPARLPAQVAGRWGQINWNNVQWGKKPGQPRQDKSLLYRHDEPSKPTSGKTPFICTLWVPIWLSFNSQQGPTISSLSGMSIIFNTVTKIPTGALYSTFVWLGYFDSSWNTFLRTFCCWLEMCPWLCSLT